LFTRDEPEAGEDKDVAGPGHGDEDLIYWPLLEVYVPLEHLPVGRIIAPLSCTRAVAVLGNGFVDAEAAGRRPDGGVGLVVAGRGDRRKGTQTLDRFHDDGRCDVRQADVADRLLANLEVGLDTLEIDRIERAEQFVIECLLGDPYAVAPVAALAWVLLVVGDADSCEGLVAYEQEVDCVGPGVRLPPVHVADLVDHHLFLGDT